MTGKQKFVMEVSSLFLNLSQTSDIYMNIIEECHSHNILSKKIKSVNLNGLMSNKVGKPDLQGYVRMCR